MAGKLAHKWAEMKWAKAVNLPKLARDIHIAARVSEQFIDPSRVFIASVYDVLHAQKKTKLTLVQFKAILPMLMQRDYVVCTRADMVGVLADDKRVYGPLNAKQKLLERSETTYLSATWHLIATDR